MFDIGDIVLGIFCIIVIALSCALIFLIFKIAINLDDNKIEQSTCICERLEEGNGNE